MRTHRQLLTGLACLSLAACEKNGLPEVEAVQQNVVVQGFDDCTGLEDYIEDRAVLAMRATLLGKLEDETTLIVPGANDAAPEMSLDGSSTNKTAPSAYTTTNLQVAGVDEADFMKNTGTRILVLSGQRLFVTQSWPADQLQVLSSLEIEGVPQEMFLNEQKQVVVFSEVFESYPWSPDQKPCYDAVSCAAKYGNTVKITVVDLSNEAAPQVVRSEYLPGSYLSSRRVGSSVRVVTRAPFLWPAGVEFYLHSSANRGDRALRAAAYDELMERNEKLIRAEPLEHWVPKGKRLLPDGSESEVGYSCREFARPSGATQLGLVTVATLDLASTAPLSRSSLVAAADEVYSNGTSLYLATAHWWWWPRAGQSDWTYLHKYDLSQPAGATYLASGAVEGRIVDQFSMDEHQGYLRVATNLVKRVESPGSWRGTSKWTSRVQVVEQDGGALALVGSTGDLADHERLYSSRFIGNRGYLVTFHEVIRQDPLFTLDLSDPTQPRVVGQLEMPGYSNYLHPVDDTHLLAVGVGDNNGVKVSLYDLTDFANPRTQSEIVVGSLGASSEAQQDHKAFNYFPEKKLLAIPFFTSTWSLGFVSQLKIFRVDVATGLTLVGTLDVSDMYGPYLGYSWDWRVSPAVRRSVMADDFVYAVSDAGIRSANVGALAAPLATVRFSPPTR